MQWKSRSVNYKEEQKEAAAQGSENGRGRGWIPGLVLIALGIIFLLMNFTSLTLNGNWWALFILIPAAINLGKVWSHYQVEGRFTRGVRGHFVGGLVLTLVALTLFFDWDWGVIWPLFLIIGGLGALLGAWFD